MSSALHIMICGRQIGKVTKAVQVICKELNNLVNKMLKPPGPNRVKQAVFFATPANLKSSALL